MSKTLIANPVAGLKGIPARITLERNGLVVKSGLLGSKSFPYSSIDQVSFTGVSSLTMSGDIIIVPKKGNQIRLLGFYKSQFKEVQNAVMNGCYDDSNTGLNDDSADSNSGNINNVSDEVILAQIKAKEKEAELQAAKEKAEAEREAEEEKARQERIAAKDAQEQTKIQEIQQIAIETSDSEIMVRNLNHLIGIIDSTDGNIMKAALSKYKTQLDFLKNIEPKHPMLKMFNSKYKKSKLKGCLIAVVIVFVVLIIILKIIF